MPVGAAVTVDVSILWEELRYFTTAEPPSITLAEGGNSIGVTLRRAFKDGSGFGAIFANAGEGAAKPLSDVPQLSYERTSGSGFGFSFQGAGDLSDGRAFAWYLNGRKLSGTGGEISLSSAERAYIQTAGGGAENSPENSIICVFDSNDGGHYAAEERFTVAQSADPTPSADLFVDGTNGDDTTGDGSAKRPFATLKKAVDAGEAGDNYTAPYTIYVSGTTAESANITITKAVTITNAAGTEGATIGLVANRVPTGSLITVRQNATISNLIFDGNGSRNLRCMEITKDATLVLSSATIHNFTTRSDGGGVYIVGGGTFIMTDSTISKNSEHGVYMKRDGSFTIHGGTISQNTTTGGYGGGIYVDGGTYEQDSSAKIIDNRVYGGLNKSNRCIIMGTIYTGPPDYQRRMTARDIDN